MTRVFRRGELKPALLAVVASLGEGHGYAIMKELQARVGGEWRPSPGAIYPALLGLEESGLLQSEEHDSLRVYHVTARGAAALRADTGAPPWTTLAERAGAEPPAPTLAGLLERFREQLPAGGQCLSTAEAEAIGRVLAAAGERVRSSLKRGEQGESDG